MRCKDRQSAQDKIARKGYASAAEITDAVRGGFAVHTPAEAEAVAAGLALRFDTIDEGWSLGPSGYLDRKIVIRFADGVIGEVQMAPPAMWSAKAEQGQRLYTARRVLPLGDPRHAELLAKEKAVYSAAIEGEWAMMRSGAGGAEGNRAAKAASESTRPLSSTSARLNGADHAEPPRGTKTAASPSMSAGRPSQSTNSMGETSAFEDDLPRAAAQGRGEAFIAADPELRHLAEETDALAAKAGTSLPAPPPNAEPNSVAEAIRSAALCLIDAAEEVFGG